MTEQSASEHLRVLNAIAVAKDQEKQYEILSHFLTSSDLRASTELLNDVIAKATENMMHGKAFLLLLDFSALMKTIGKKNYDQLMHAFRASEKMRKALELLDQTKKLKPKQVPLFKAKVGMLLQVLFLLQERVSEEGLPPLKMSAVDLANKALDRIEGEMRMVIDLNDFGKGYWNLLVEILKEADFRSDDKILYELVLTSNMIKLYSSGAHLAGTAKGEAGAGALSDAMLSRMGRNIVKRLGLLLRTMKMYQSADHPSVELSLESLHGTISEVLEQRKSITFTRLGSDLLIDDVKNRKKEKFVDDFVVLLDERNVNSITITQGVSVEEIRAFTTLFAFTQAQVKQAGGPAVMLEKAGVTHILMDQFKYGIISADAVEEADTVSHDEKMLENIVFTELVAKLKEGKGIGDLKSEDVGAAFKQLISGAFRKDNRARQTLAQMLLAIDPSLAEKALFSKEGLRGDIQWSSAQRMIDELLVELVKGKPEDRIHTLENLSKMADLAISKSKDTTLTVIVEKIVERLRLRERDLDVVQKVVEVLAEICKALIVNGKYGQALDVLRNMYQVRNRCDNLPSEKKDELCFALPDLIARAMNSVSDSDVVDALVRDLDNESLETIDRIVRILEILNTEEVVNKLLGGFTHDSRSVRNRCFQALLSIGEKTLAVTTWKLKSLGDPGTFSRYNDGTLEEESYYLARNCIDLISKMGKQDEIQLLKELTDDPDPRIRREVMLSLAKMNPEEGTFLARLRLTDPDPMVIKAAISTLGNLKNEAAEHDLVDLFYAQHELQTTILNSLALIGGKESEELMIGATKLRFGGHLGRIFRMDPDLRMTAIKALGQCGTQLAQKALRKFVRRLRNPIIRLFLFPMKSLRTAGDLMRAGQDSLSRIEFRMKKPAS